MNGQADAPGKQAPWTGDLLSRRAKPLADGHALRQRGIEGVAVVSGGLGSLGLAAAQALLRRRWAVLAVDNLDPAAAPAPLRQQRLGHLLEHEAAHFLPLDLRHPELAMRLDTALAGLAGSLPLALLLAHGLSPRREWERSEPELARQTLTEASLRLVDWAGTRGASRLVVASHTPLEGEADPRQASPGWQRVLDGEAARRELLGEGVRELELPLLVGLDMVPADPPRRSWRELVSRAALCLPAPDAVATRALGLEEAARALMLAVSEDEMPEGALPPPFALDPASLLPWLEQAAGVGGTRRPEALAALGPAARAGDVLPDVQALLLGSGGGELEAFLRMALEAWRDDGVTPPPDWPSRLGSRAGRRRRRRRS